MNKFTTLLLVSLLISGCSYMAQHPEAVNELTDIEKGMINDFLTPKVKDEKAAPLPCPDLIDSSGMHDHISKH